MDRYSVLFSMVDNPINLSVFHLWAGNANTQSGPVPAPPPPQPRNNKNKQLTANTHTWRRWVGQSQTYMWLLVLSRWCHTYLCSRDGTALGFGDLELCSTSASGPKWIPPPCYTYDLYDADPICIYIILRDLTCR